MGNHFLRKTVKYVLFLLNMLFSLSLILACFGGGLFDGTVWITGLFSFACIYLLAAVLIFFVFWLFAKPALTLISIATIFLCWKPLKQVFPLNASSDFNFKKNASAIRIMSWNVELFNILEYKTHPEKKKEMFKLINEINPDIACFQEMVIGDSATHRINFINEFQKKIGMTEYHYSFNPVFDFDKMHHYGIITFSKYPIIKKETLVFKPYDYNSTFQYSDIVKDRDTFRVVNIHLQTFRLSPKNKKYLDNPSFGNEKGIEESKNILWKLKVGIQNRRRQSNHIKSMINESPYPVILCGDFNDVPNSYAYSTIGKNMQNAFAETGFGIGNTYDGISPTLRIDNIFTDNKFEVLQFGRFKKKLSDHFPISADLLLNK